jgi:hypothetical protein
MRPNCETDVISMLVTRPEDMYLTRRFSTGHLFHERRTAGGRSLHLSDSYLPQASLPKFPSSAFRIGIGSCLQSVSIYQRQPSYLPEDVRRSERAIALIFLSLRLPVPLFSLSIGKSIPHVLEGDLIVRGCHRGWATCGCLQDIVFAGLLKEAASGGVGVGKRHDGLKGLRGSQFFLRFFSVLRIPQ